MTPPIDSAHPYRGVTIAMATRHQKERVVGPAFATALSARIVVAKGVDTDRLGTFTGEVPREGTPIETALLKARLACRDTGVPFAVASEGSFGPHPAIPFIACGQENLVFLDADRQRHIVERSITSTNFDHHVTADAQDEGTRSFLDRIGFGSHAVIVRPHTTPSPGAPQPLIKGIHDPERLQHAIHECNTASACGRSRLETDMRAHLNPTRMHHIGQLATALARTIAARCPSCAAPGYGMVAREPGLPCALCGTPTDDYRNLVLACGVCPYQASEPRDDGHDAADPVNCPSCNP